MYAARWTRSITLFVILTSILALFTGTGVRAADDHQPLRDDNILERFSASHNRAPSDFVVGNRARTTHELTGTSYELVKIVDTKTGETYQIALDAQGNEIDPFAAEAAEARVTTERFGKLDPALSDTLGAMDDAATIPVTLWLNLPESEVTSFTADQSATIDEMRAARATHLAEIEGRMSGQRRGAIGALAELGATVIEPKYAPILFANLTKGQIETIAQRDDVAAIYGQVEYALLGDDAQTTNGTVLVWRRGNAGQSGAIRPVIHEPGGVAFNNPYLNNANHGISHRCAIITPGCPNGRNEGAYDGHATKVAGVIASTHPHVRGVAWDIDRILSANFGSFEDAKMVAAFEWALDQGGDPINMSWGRACGGDQTFMSRYVDYAVRYLRVTVVAAAGNTETYDQNGEEDLCNIVVEDEKVGSPGVAWNAITVGAYFDHKNGDWSDDAMWPGSAWRNPDFSPNMQKPEVVAPGADISTTDLSADHVTGTSSVDGTSFAAPQVAGQVALMYSAKPVLAHWPETTKAVVLASAFHDIEAGSQEKDGVGAIVTNISDDTVRNDRFINDCEFSCVAGQFSRTYYIPLEAGKPTRIAMAYDAWSTGGNGTDILGADLDMIVRNPSGTVVAHSTSFQNAWELVEFDSGSGGTYTAEVKLQSSASGWPGTRIGLAWAYSSKPNLCTGKLTANFSAGKATINLSTTKGSTYLDFYENFAKDQSGRERVIKFKTNGTKDVTISDTNQATNADNGLDLHLVQIANCAADPILDAVTSLAHAGGPTSTMTIDNLPAGTYYVIVDSKGDIGNLSDTVTITLAAP